MSITLKDDASSMFAKCANVITVTVKIALRARQMDVKQNDVTLNFHEKSSILNHLADIKRKRGHRL